MTENPYAPPATSDPAEKTSSGASPGAGRVLWPLCAIALLRATAFFAIRTRTALVLLDHPRAKNFGRVARVASAFGGLFGGGPTARKVLLLSIVLVLIATTSQVIRIDVVLVGAMVGVAVLPEREEYETS